MATKFLFPKFSFPKNTILSRNYLSKLFAGSVVQKNEYHSRIIKFPEYGFQFQPSVLETDLTQDGPNHRNVHRTACDFKEVADPAVAKNKIVYSIVPKEKSEIVSRFLIKHYHTTEPISVALNMPLSEIGEWFRLFIRSSMFVSICDVSVQAIDETLRRRVGVLSALVYDPLVSKPCVRSRIKKDTHPVNAQMNEFFDTLEQGLDPAAAAEVQNQAPRPSKVLEHMYIAVRPGYGGLGIGHKMIDVSESLVKNIINCRVGYLIATSEYSYKAFQKHGYKIAKEIKYSDYADSKGQKIFSGKENLLGPHDRCRIMVKEFPEMHK